MLFPIISCAQRVGRKHSIPFFGFFKFLARIVDSMLDKLKPFFLLRERSSEVKESLFFFSFCKNLGFFSNLQISVALTTFLHRIDGLFLKYDMIISYPGNLSSFRTFPDFPQIFKFQWF